MGNFPKRKDYYEKTVANRIDGYYFVSDGVYSGVHRRYYQQNKHLSCNINWCDDFTNDCNTDAEHIFNSSAKSKDTYRDKSG